MSLDLLAMELPLRLCIAVGVFAAMATWELREHVISLRVAKGRRWIANVSLVALDTLVVRLVFPAGLVGFALWVEEMGWGLFPSVGAPRFPAAVVSFLALDFAVYAQHVAFHRAPLLWRFHRVHHADHDVDVTTGLRFHPVEIVLSLGWKLVVVAALGIPAEAVFVFEIVLNATSLWSHANVALPVSLDRVTRWALVTPDMHRIHHSVERPEHSSNFGFSFSWWDRLMGTYRPESAAGRRQLNLGLREFSPPGFQSLSWMLALPWRRQQPPTPTSRDVPRPRLDSRRESMELERTPAPVDRDLLREAIKGEYALVAKDPSHGFHFHTGRRLAELLAYRAEWLSAMPESALASFAGTGNPFVAGELAPGERVVDVGCGAGFDTLIAARMVGPQGRVVGVDMTPEMLERACGAVQTAGAANVDLRLGYAEELPVEDAWADVVISNGVLNLAPDKEAAFGELARVVRPGGRLQIGDLLVAKPVPEAAKAKIDLWTG